MRRYWLSLSALVGLLLVPLSASGFGYRIDPFQWRLEWLVDDPKPFFHFTIWNTQVGGSSKALAYQERAYGISLGWGDGRTRRAGHRQWFFTRAEAIEPSHKLAIVNTTRGGCLVFDSDGQAFGIDLKWTEWRGPRRQRSCDDEWRLRTRRGLYALYNDVARDYVVYGERRFGINLRWLADAESDLFPAQEKLRDVYVSVRWRKLSGGLVFRGRLTAGRRLESLISRNKTTPLRLLQRGRRPTDCSHADATVTVEPHTEITAEQMIQVFGSEAPELPVDVLVCSDGHEFAPSPGFWAVVRQPASWK